MYTCNASLTVVTRVYRVRLVHPVFTMCEAGSPVFTMCEAGRVNHCFRASSTESGACEVNKANSLGTTSRGVYTTAKQRETWLFVN